MHDQDIAIVKSLVSVAWADGVFAQQEAEMIEALLASFNATEAEAQSIRDYAAEKRTIDDIPLPDLSADDRRVVLQHAVLLSYVDGEQHASEKEYLSKLSQALRIPEAEATTLMAQAESRAKRHLKLL